MNPNLTKRPFAVKENLTIRPGLFESGLRFWFNIDRVYPNRYLHHRLHALVGETDGRLDSKRSELEESLRTNRPCVGAERRQDFGLRPGARLHIGLTFKPHLC